MKTNEDLRRETEPQPPVNQARFAEHHWLQQITYDGHYGSVIVLQWNPSAKRWSHSGDVGTGVYVDTGGWRYLGPCEMPDASLATLRFHVGDQVVYTHPATKNEFRVVVNTISPSKMANYYDVEVQVHPAAVIQAQKLGLPGKFWVCDFSLTAFK